MTTSTTITASDLYAQIATAFVSDPDLESKLLADFEGAVSQRFGVKLLKPATLVRAQDGYCLTYDGKVYDLGNPRTARPGELNDAELELVSGGGGNVDCPQAMDAPMFSDPTPARSRTKTG